MASDSPSTRAKSEASRRASDGSSSATEIRTPATVARIGTLAAVAGAIGIAGARIGGRLADRFPLTRVLIAVQLLRALASSALLVTDPYALLLVSASLGGLGDRAASVLTKLYATRVAGPDRVRYQAVHRTLANAGWAIGGLAVAAALALGSTAAYQWLLGGDALSFVAAALLSVRCGEPPSTRRTVATSKDPSPATKPTNPWRDRTYLAYVATETVLFRDDAAFKVDLPLWIAHASDVPQGLAPLLLVLNNVMVVALQAPLARFGATTAAARKLLIPLSAAFALGGATMALSAVGGAVSATLFPPHRPAPSPWPRCSTPPFPGSCPWPSPRTPHRAPTSASMAWPSPPSAASDPSRSPPPSPPARSAGPPSVPPSL